MNRLLKELHALLEKKIVLYDRFIELLGEQWDCLTGYSLEGLQDIQHRKEALVDAMQKLERDRGELMQRIEVKLAITQPGGVTPSGLTLKRLLRMQSHSMNEPLARSRERLLAQIGRINQWHERLRALMDSSALSLKRSMVFIHSAAEAATSPYHADGRLSGSSRESRMLSTEA